MAGMRQPIQVVKANGRKNLTIAETKKREKQEIQPITDNIIAPDILNKKQALEFYKISEQLEKLGIMGETDVDALARYIIAKDLYEHTVKQMRKTDVKNDPIQLEAWSKLQERYFKQCRQCANDLGLTISSRCRLVVPESKEPPKQNKFKQFEKGLTVVK